MDELVFAPFRNIVSQGRIAIGNADGGRNNDMLKAAQSLVKEGERALKRIEPLCLKNYEDFGSVFVDTLKGDREISQLIEELNDLLYDFDEYTEAESFNAEKFTRLQGLSKKSAPRISHIITRMILAPQKEDQDVEPVTSSAAFEQAVLARQPSESVVVQGRESLPYPEDTEPEVKYASMPYPTDLNQDISLVPVGSSLGTQLPPFHQEQPPPRPPSFLDPWPHNFRHPSEGYDQRYGVTISSDSALGSDNTSECNCSPVITGLVKPSQPFASPCSPERIVTTATLGHSLDQNASLATRPRRDSNSPISARSNLRDSVASSANASLRSSASDHRPERDSVFDVVSPISPTHRLSTYPPDVPARSSGQSPHVYPLFTRPSSRVSASSENSGLETPALGIPDGLMPVEEERLPEPAMSLPDAETQLGGCVINLNSSYDQYKGFCPGAVEIIQGGLGIKHIKKQGLVKGNIEVARCKSCAYELEWKAVEKDVNNEPTENFKSAGIGFRLRFLSKSHLHTKNVGEQVYGCLFCVQLRQTTHPNDATVFFSQQQLFAHLARHPRPLPHIPGLTVVLGEVPQQFANKYDLHFVGPPRESHLANFARKLTTLPMATAMQTCRPAANLAMRRPPDGTEVLSFAAGARILGIEFPGRYMGEWCLGWADHEHGLIPVDAVRLVPPRRSDFGSLEPSSLKAVARWRFSVKDSKENKGGMVWLSFGKGEMIANIGWSHQDHWCWWGTNTKGRSGLFPRAHIEPGTLMEAIPKSDGASGAGYERKPGLLSRLSIQHRSNGSVGGAGGGGRSTSPRASIY